MQNLLRPYNLPNNYYIRFRLKQLSNDYPEIFHDAIIGYRHFMQAKGIKVFNRHIENLFNTYGKTNVLSCYMAQREAKVFDKIS